MPNAAHAKNTARRFIKDFDAAEYVSGLFCISNAQMGRTKNDKPFLKCLIRDKTGEVPGRMWSIETEQFKKLPTEGFVYLEGETQPYQGELQLIIRQIEPGEPTLEEMRELIPTSKRDPEEMFAEMVTVLDTLVHPGMRALAKVYLDDQPLMTAFKQCPAAKAMHHAYLGGLLEHTLNLLHLADRVCPLYPKVNRDIVMMGLFLHDLGKTRELIYDRTFAYSDRGELIGHIVEGAIMLHDRSQQVMRQTGQRLPRHAAMVLQHIILSHHGVPEFGAAKVPMTPEAILVSMLDNIDAKMFIAMAVARPERDTPVDLGGNFTERQWALDTKLFRPDPLAEQGRRLRDDLLMPRERKLHDKYFKLAKAEGYAARSAYKLKQINERYNVVRRGMRVLDLGCAPGSWMQVAAEIVGPRGCVVGLDLQAVEIELPRHAVALVGDAFIYPAEDLVLAMKRAGQRDPKEMFSVVLSDMAPNTTGAGDHFRSVALCRRVLEILPRVLMFAGATVMKVFEGEEYPALLRETSRMFTNARGYKPEATRDVSCEMYIIAVGYRGGGPRGEPGVLVDKHAMAKAPPKPRPGWGSGGRDA